ETGTGAESATAEKRFGYDSAGRLTSASSPKGDNAYEYDDRGQLLKSTGPSGNASYAYNPDGQLTSRTDAAGTSLFTYARQRLSTTKDALTGTTQSYGYDVTGALERVDYGPGHSRSVTYDTLGRVDTDTVKNSAGQPLSSVDYGYDTGNQLTSKTTTGTARPGTNTYTYDDLGRLTSWTAEGATTEYGWDDSGNRIRNGTKTATYDERNRLLSDGDYTYDHTPRGTLATRTSSGLTENYTFDAFDRLTQAGESNTAYTYDSLDRIASRGITDFTYAGLAPDPVKDQSASYGRGAADELLSVAEGAGPARLTLDDKHGDITGTLSATNGAATTLDESAAYDPFGQRQGLADVSGNAGYQGDFTDPATGQISMHARWYDPGTGTFDSRDAVQYTAGASTLANRYTYGAGAPTNFTDPDGNWPCSSWNDCKKKVKKKVKAGLKKAAEWGNKGLKYASSVWSGVVWAVTNPIAAVKASLKALGKAAKWVGKKTGITDAYNAVVSGTKKRWDDGTQWLKRKAEEAKKAAREYKRQITKRAKAAVVTALRSTSIGRHVLALKPLLAAGVAIVSSLSDVPAALVDEARNAVADMATAAEAIREAAVRKVGEVVESVTEAVDWGAVWEGTKTGLNVLAEVTGYNDLKSCVTQGDIEACAWTAATIAGALAGGAGAGAVRGARAARMASKGASHADGIADATRGGRTLDRVEAVTSCVETAVAVAGNSFLPGTKVLMADGSRTPIEKVREGDTVLATDPTTGKTSRQKVTATITGSGEKHLVELTLDTDGPRGTTTGKLTATTGHPFWVPSLKKWLKAGELKPGQWLHTGAGTSVQLDAVRAWTQKAAVYNLTVDRAHTYYALAGATPVLVHNAEPCRFPWSSGRVSAAVRAINEGRTKITVGSRSEAEEIFLGRFQGDGYRNAAGFDGKGTRQYFGSKSGTYHWDDQLGTDGRVLGHGADNRDGDLPHLQIHTFEDSEYGGSIIRISWEE
ncbi:polymorphic toxin-type HINT domain-containing protein, partial [Streptomyces sp. NPDC057638]|uniref:polymorphic toxin-type HINT domain-containing protein n=1 Tax=Streptomyces sp. NPDC057638 TaxID=3346190 RepID=UPI0036CAFE02